jgi:hypothetical protein
MSKERGMKPLLLFFITGIAHDQLGLRRRSRDQGRDGKKIPYSKIISVSKTPYSGLHEVAFDGHLVCTDEKMTYLFSGNILDMHTLRNLTEAWEKQQYAINFDNLPLDLAIKNV